jgi:hypothetical protein
MFSRGSKDVGRKIEGCRKDDAPQNAEEVYLTGHQIHFDDLASHVLGNPLVTVELLRIFYHQVFSSVLSAIMLW